MRISSMEAVAVGAVKEVAAGGMYDIEEDAVEGAWKVNWAERCVDGW